MSSITKRKSNKGLTLVEVLVYTVGLVLLVGAITGFLYYMYGWYRAVTLGPRVDQTAIAVITKLEQDLHSGNIISSINQDSSNGSITIVSTTNSVSTTTAYALSNGHITWQQNGGTISYLTPSDMTVSGLYLHQISTSNSTAVHFEIDMTYQTSNGTTTNIYSGLAILHQSYQ